uniref:Uncharacterized protein n=1 Tax=Athene cunicularia TaxID=194338 RepID=A0A663M2J3_ATHCN
TIRKPKQVEPKLYSKIRKYVSEVNESIGDARRQLVGYLLEKDKVWFENSSEWHQEKKESPRRKKRERTNKKKGKNPQLSRTANPRKDHADVGIFDAVAKGYLSELEKTWRDNDIDALNSSSETLLHVATANGHLRIMEYLISKGAKIDVKDRKGRTPLHRAAEKGHGDAVKVLLQRGAYMYSLDTEGKTPLHLAAQNNHVHIVRMLLKEEARTKDMDGCTPMHYAAIKGNTEIVKILLTSRKNKNIDDRNIWRKTTLHIAAEHGHSNLINLLLTQPRVPALGCMCELIQLTPQL